MSTSIDDLDPYPRTLALAALAEFEEWLVRRAVAIVGSSNLELDATRRSRISEQAKIAHRALGMTLIELLATDVDAQRKGPLQVIREAATLMNVVLVEVGVPVVVRDEFETRAMPADVFGIGPIAWLDMGDVVHEAGIEWGAWKAASVLQRRRDEGKLDP